MDYEAYNALERLWRPDKTRFSIRRKKNRRTVEVNMVYGQDTHDARGRSTHTFAFTRCAPSYAITRSPSVLGISSRASAA